MIKEVIKNIFEKLLYIKAEITWKRHINKVYRHLGIKNSDLDTDLITKHQQYWGQLKRKVNPKWFRVYSHITENFDIHYVPENIYFNIIEEKLNNRKHALAFGDKNFYEVFYDNKDIFPESIIRNIDGVFYDHAYNLLTLDDNRLKQYLSKYQKILIKPSADSGGGKKIQLFFNKNNNFTDNQNHNLTVDYLHIHCKDNYVIQNYIRQSEFLAQFNSSSVNTIRIFTYRSVVTDEVIPLHAVLRIGKEGNYIDDQNVGGVACRINEDSTLNDFATNYFGEKFFEFNRIVFSQVKTFPLLKEMKQLTIQLARKNIHSRVMGFDFTINFENNIKLIEINHLWTGINFFQMNGSTVFGKYTDEVIEFCSSNKKGLN